MLSQELLDILACPSCKGAELQYDDQKDTLTCWNRHCPFCGMPVNESGTCQDSACGKPSTSFVALRYRVEDDIPIMIIYEAEKLPLAPAE